MRIENQLRKLPYGIVYYLESCHNENLNCFIKEHLVECESIMNAIPNLVRPFKIVYVNLFGNDVINRKEYLNNNVIYQNIIHKNLIGRTLYSNGNWVVSSMSLETYFTSEVIDYKSNRNSSTFYEELQKNQIFECFKSFAKILQKIPQEKYHNTILAESNEIYQKKLTDKEIAYRIMNDVNTLSEHEGLCLLQELYGMKIMLEKQNYQKLRFSRLRVDINYNILLIDYNNQQVSMAPLMKTVYFLFLLHPEGIRIKEICDYKRDITMIYRQLTNKTSEEKIKFSIKRLVDPSDNSLSEKLSFIKKTFQDTFMSLGISLSNMQEYVPQGYRGGLYKIALSRSLIVLPNSLMNLIY